MKSPCADEVASIDEEPISLTLEDAEGCPRYMGVVIKDMKVGESPKWLKDALEVIGQRGLTSIVWWISPIMLYVELDSRCTLAVS